MTPQEIRDAIAANAELQALASAGNVDAIARALSVGRTKLGTVSTPVFASWAAGTGMRAVIEDRAAASGDPLRSSALALRDVLTGGMAGIRLDYPPNVAMLDAWVALGALSADHRASLIALATEADPIVREQVTEAIYD